MSKSANRKQINIRHFGQVNQATFKSVNQKEYPVERQDFIAVDMSDIEDGSEWYLIPCAPYDEHFIFEVPDEVKQIPGAHYHMCTCGSVAVINNPKSPINEFRCLMELEQGIHQTSLVNKDDIEQGRIGQDPIKGKARKWLI